jgi:recombinational DNA repair protein RecT
MWLAEIERVRCGSKQTRNGESSGTWAGEWQAMALKTLIRRAIKTMALTPDVADKLDYALSNEDAKMGKPDSFIDVTPGEPTAPAEGREKIGATE